MKQFTRIIITTCLLCLSALPHLNAQKDTSFILPDRGEMNELLNHRHKEIGLNMTFLISQFVPLGGQVLFPGVIDYSFKLYDSKQNAFRFGFGASWELLSFIERQTNIRAGMRLGYEKRKHLYKKFYYTWGVDGLFYLGPIRGGESPNSIEGGIGLGPVIGIEYQLNDYMYLSTESMLFFGLPTFINVIPPTAIFLHFMIP